HTLKPVDSIFVEISGPKSVEASDTAIYILRIANGPSVAGGCDISSSLGNVYTSALDTSLKREKPFTGAGFELTHKYPKLFVNDTLSFTFTYIAPDTSNVIDTLFANGNSTNMDTTSDNDQWNYAENFLINITPKSAITNNNTIANSFELHQNYPNPFNPETKINFNIIKSSDVTFRIYDINGKLIANLIDNKFYTQGNYTLTFNAQQYSLTSGVYFYKLSVNNYLQGQGFSDLKKMMLIK
ncbi:MAG: choice-of-anchor V domain-containing protein, partial [bacterium]